MRDSSTCSQCGVDNNHVIETRKNPYGDRRRRKCLACGKIWTTIEINAELFVQLVEIATTVDDLRVVLARVPALTDVKRRTIAALDRRPRVAWSNVDKEKDHGDRREDEAGRPEPDDAPLGGESEGLPEQPR